MNVVRTVSDARAAVEALRAKAAESGRSTGRSESGRCGIGLVPTMGYFHEGHLSLMRASCAENGATIVSLYVNPLQFAPGEDLAAYPRDFERDRRLAESVGVDVMFAPSDEEMYSGDAGEQLAAAGGHRTGTEVLVHGLNAVLEGAVRPTHFNGVATVVLKLLNILAPDRAYFGQKDFQQVKVVEAMVRDLNVAVAIRMVPTRRETDGLAMSSRNIYLTPAERAAAPILHRALVAEADAVRGGERDGRRLAGRLAERISAEPLARLDYAVCVDPETLEPLERVEGHALLAVACRFGKARLIDNEFV